MGGMFDGGGGGGEEPVVNVEKVDNVDIVLPNAEIDLSDLNR